LKAYGTMATRPGFGVRKLENPRQVLLFGANGNLGAALRRRLTASGHRVQSISWKDVAEWLDHSSKTQEQRIRGAISQIAADNIDILFANGLTDPRQPVARLFMSNTQFPQSVIAATRCMRGCRYMTFGTILERFGGNSANNAYAASKIELAEWVKEPVDRNSDTKNLDSARLNLKGRIIHLQIHTLYGGLEPAPHMFLGQLVAALQLRQPFAMSSGQQLREYHHVDDVAGSVDRLLSYSPWPLDPILTLSSGQPVQLGALARAVFASAGRISDLRIGVLPTDETENLKQSFAASPAWLLEPSREPVRGVCAWIDTLLHGA
jgi:nucleoside-diphosphate-sugar epimerase